MDYNNLAHGFEPNFDAWVPVEDELLYMQSASTDNVSNANAAWPSTSFEPAGGNKDLTNDLSLEELTIRTQEAYVEQGFCSSLDVDFLRPSFDVPQTLCASSQAQTRPRAHTENTRSIPLSSGPRPRTSNRPPRPLSTSDIPEIEFPAGRMVCCINCPVDSDSMVFECRVLGCDGTYARWADFKRHYDGAHAIARPEYWCPEAGCERSEAFGGAPFPRKDKMMDHAWSMHGLTVSRVNSKRKRHV